MKHALEVAKAGSLSKASETLLIAAPNISRSVKELENDLGITIFNRTQNGMKLTPDGEEFIGFAKEILARIDEVESFYKSGVQKKQRFSISVPRASYISEAFAEFSKTLPQNAVEVFYEETNSQRTIRNLTENNYNLGIIRYAREYDKYFESMLKEKDFSCELVADFTYSLVTSVDSPLAKKPEITLDDLTDYIEIAHADPYVPSLPLSKVAKESLPDSVKRRIFVFERASQFDLLSSNAETYMWVSPLPDSLLERYNLVQRKCAENNRIYKDVLIYKNGYKLSASDKQFITKLCESKRKYLR